MHSSFKSKQRSHSCIHTACLRLSQLWKVKWNEISCFLSVSPFSCSTFYTKPAAGGVTDTAANHRVQVKDYRLVSEQTFILMDDLLIYNHVHIKTFAELKKRLEENVKEIKRITDELKAKSPQPQKCTFNVHFISCKYWYLCFLMVITLLVCVFKMINSSWINVQRFCAQFYRYLQSRQWLTRFQTQQWMKAITTG